MTPLQSAQAYLLDVEHELADAHDRIRLLIAERDTARLQADQRVSLREEFRELLGTDEIEQGVVVVRGLQERIKRLEEMYEGKIGENEQFLGSNLQGLLTRELNAAQERIKRLEAVTNDPHALWVNWLRGSVALPVGIGDVREYQDRIKRLEEALEGVTDKIDNAWGIYMKFKEAKP